MSRSFDGTADDLATGSAVVTATPFTVAIWAQHHDIGGSTSRTAVAFTTNGSGNNRWELRAVGTSQNVTALATTTTSQGATASLGFDDTGWHLMSGSFVSNISRAAYFDGANKGTNTVDRAPSGVNQCRIGALESGGGIWLGLLAHLAVWANTTLTDAEHALLGQRVSPLFVRPQDLVLYTPYLGRDASEIDIIGGKLFTVTGTTADAAEPPLLWLPGRRRIFLPAGATTHSVSMTETGSADDVLTGIIQTAVVLTENGSAADAHGAALTAVVALTESASGADVIAAIATRLGALTESGAATDQVDGSIGPATYSVTIIETSAAADVVNAGLQGIAALGESGNGADAYTALLSVLRSLSESGAAADAPVALWSGLASLSEVGAAIDSISVEANLVSGGSRIVIVRMQRRTAALASNHTVAGAARRTVHLLQ